MKWVVSLHVVISSHCVLQCGASGCVALHVMKCASGPTTPELLALGERPVTHQQVTVYL